MPEADHSTLYLIWQTIYEVYLATVSSPDAGAPPLLCTEWTKYDAFASWAHEHGYQNGLYLERINIPQSYSPENCVWTDVRHRSKNAPRLIAAFGENKSFAAWANDIRCTVDVMTIRYRLHRGWNPEQAISTPPAKRTRHDSGATPSTIALGAQFDRLTVIGPCVIGRNRKGKPSYLYRCKCTCGNEVTVEASSLLYANIHSCGCFKREKFIELHTIHGEAHTRLYVQWQSIREHAEALRGSLSSDEIPIIEASWVKEYATFRDWARAHDYAEDRHLIRLDKARGYTADNCKWVDRRTQTHHTKEVAVYTAFGDTKPLTLWVEDDRCVISYQTLQRRLSKGWTLDAALTTQSQPLPSRVMTAFGETKALHAWSQDSRCVIGKSALEKRLREGWTLEDALTTPRSAPPMIITVAGDSKSLTDWVNDQRCVVEIATLRNRVQSGWDPAQALTTPALKRPSRPVTAWGETKVLSAWAADGRCVVSHTTLSSRLADGWDFTEALTMPAGEELPKNTILLTAFGETKSISAWSRDQRCCVSRLQLMRRLRQQLEPERALTTPAKLKHRHPSGYTMTTIPVGARFGLLTVTSAYTRVQFPSGTYGYLYLCSCDCGTLDHRVSANNLLCGQVSSCGCQKRAKRVSASLRDEQ